MFAGWLIFLFASFGVSLLVMTHIQVRAASKYGWFGQRQRPFLDIYWRDLSPLERCLLWLGFMALGVTISFLSLREIAAWLGR